MARTQTCVGAAALTVAVLAAGIGSNRLAAVTCEIAAVQAAAPEGTVITGVTSIEASDERSGYCQVDGHATSSRNTVTFRLALPESWNGKFLFVGVGGLGGTLPSLESGVRRGYATATTDTGHSSSDPTWAGDPDKEVDYGYRGTHVTAVAAKAVTTGVFGTPPKHAYFNGCSNGGRQALMEAQRYPDDFDGVIAGHPATGTPMQVGRAVVYQQMLASPGNYLTAESIDLIAKATLAACDKTDGLEDGLVSDPRQCRFDPAVLSCAGEATAGCLTPGQVATARLIYGGVKTPDGRRYVQGFPPGHEDGATGWLQWIAGATPPVAQPDGTLAYDGPKLPAGYGFMDFNFRFLSFETDDPAFGWRGLDLARDLPRMKAMTRMLTPDNADLRPFKRRGGKLLMYHGWSDPGISALGTLDYHNRVVRAVGGQRQADMFLRTYFVPGMHHCGGGPGPNSFDMLAELERWVEQKSPPADVVATRFVDGKAVRTRPLCPHPQVARYRGTGSVDDAASFSCEVGP
ncbi:MAG: tannase/feruloyl esterase family alpha/beta hydrolase [Acidobacteriota bacterium]|nr:tannase/feruloyl esterase family alpha/beta hydrolase [Acidobacteriota bacterium]